MKCINILILCCTCQLLIGQATKMELLSVWRDSTIKGTRQYSNAYNACWGLVVNGKEYGVIGSTVGTHIIDYSDPTTPKEIFRLKGREQGTHVVHREYFDYNCHLYIVCGEGNKNTLQILDISKLPNEIKMVYDTNTLFTTCHDLFIDQQKGILYTTSEYSKSGFAPLGVYDINDPSNPKLLGRFSKFENYRVGHVHAGSAKNDTVIIHNGYDGFAILDFTDKTAPKVLQSFESNSYPNAGYNHSGWFHPNGRHYCFADETHRSPLKILDMNIISNSKIINQIKAGPDISIGHNPYYTCDYLFISYYFDGLQVFDTKDPANPYLSHYYPTSNLPHSDTDTSYMGAWDAYPFLPSGNVLVSDMQNGLFLIKGIEKPCNAIPQCGSITSTNSTDKRTVLLYQNPCRTTINFSSDEEFVQFEIIQITGLIVSRGIFTSKNDYHIEIPNISPGAYFLKLFDKKRNCTILKVVIE